MQRRGFERDEMRSRAPDRRGWESSERFRSRYGEGPSGGVRHEDYGEQAYDETGDFDQMGFENSEERAWGHGGLESERDRYGRGGEYGRGRFAQRAERSQYPQSGRGGRDAGFARRDDDYIGPQGYNEQEGWFRGQEFRDDDRFEYGGRSGRPARDTHYGPSARGTGGTSQRFGGGERDYAHGGFRGYGQGSSEGFLRRAPVGQWGDDLGGPHGGRGPEGYKRADDRIREEICDQLTQHSYVDASAIRVEVKDGEVTLSGTVQSRDEKRLAEDLAESVRGIGDVRNDLRVQAQARTDATSRQTIGTPHGSGAAASDNDKQKQQIAQRTK